MSRADEVLRLQILDNEFRRRYAVLRLSTVAVPFQTRRRGAFVLAVAGVVVGSLMSRVPVYGIMVQLFSIPALAGRFRVSLQSWLEQL